MFDNIKRVLKKCTGIDLTKNPLKPDISEEVDNINECMNASFESTREQLNSISDVIDDLSTASDIESLTKQVETTEKKLNEIKDTLGKVYELENRTSAKIKLMLNEIEVRLKELGNVYKIYQWLISVVLGLEAIILVLLIYALK